MSNESETRAALIRAVQYGHRPSFDLGLTLSRTFSTFFGNIGLILLFGLLSTVASYVLLLPFLGIEALVVSISGPLDSLATSIFTAVWFFLSFAAFSSFHAFCIIVAHQDISGQADQSGQFFKNALRSAKVAVPLTVIAILFFVAYTIGLILFVIPGIIIAVGWSLLGPAYLFDGVSLFKSFGRSWSLTRGFKWWVWFALVVIGLVQFVVLNVLMLGSLAFIVPYFSANFDNPESLSVSNVLAISSAPMLVIWMCVGLASTLVAAIHAHCCELKEGGL